MMFWMIEQLATSMKVDFTEGWRVCYDDKIKTRNIELMDVILLVVQEKKVLFVFFTSESSYTHTSNWNQRQVQTFQRQIFVSMSWGIEWTEDWSYDSRLVTSLIDTSEISKYSYSLMSFVCFMLTNISRTLTLFGIFLKSWRNHQWDHLVLILIISRNSTSMSEINRRFSYLSRKIFEKCRTDSCAVNIENSSWHFQDLIYQNIRVRCRRLFDTCHKILSVLTKNSRREWVELSFR